MESHVSQERSLLICVNVSANSAAGFSINYKNQCYVEDRYLDVGAFVWYAKVLPWEFPDFSVERCFSQLLELDALCEKLGYIPHTQHRFILIARKRK